MSPHELDGKIRILEDLIRADRVARLRISHGTEGVVAPDYVVSTYEGRLLPINIYPGQGTVLVDSHGVRATLQFGGAETECFFPWESVVQVLDAYPKEVKPYVLPPVEKTPLLW